MKSVFERDFEKKSHCYWQRAVYTPVLPLGEDGRRITACKEHLDLALKTAQEGQILLKNNGPLPLKKGQKIAVFGVGQWDYVESGTGSGYTYNDFQKTLADGLMEKEAEGRIEVFRPLTEFYFRQLEEQRQEMLENGFPLPQRTYWPILRQSTMMYGRGDDKEPVPADLLAEARAFTDTALVVVSRVSGEAYDRTREEFKLSDGEKEMIRTVQKNFAHVIAVINSGAQIEAGWLEDGKIDAALLMMTPGQMGGEAAADILCGKVNPSGKLVDTWARNYEDYPSSENFEEDPYFANYTEDIFVGYRYFETIPGAKDKVVYPFGFGLSYTTFTRKIVSAGENSGTITVKVEVTNTGSVAGKEVVQAYYGAPQGKLGKAAKSLCAFQKTKELAPGESETVELSFLVKDMASYDDTGKLQKSAYVLEQGKYPIYVGSSVRDVETAYTYEVKEAFRVTEQLSERCPAIALPKKMKADGTYEELPMRAWVRPTYRKDYRSGPPKVPANALGEVMKPNAAGSKGIMLSHVLEGKHTLDEFIDQLDMKSLAQLLCGVPSTGIAQTCGFGGKPEYGVPAIMSIDAGLRVPIDTGVHPVCFPPAATLACTWDLDLAYTVSEAMALEIKENNIYSWLGPALNIHRDPLCGRNFEYFAEDPYLSGKMGAASVLASQKHRISACPKHFAANNKELNRKESDSRVTERALREIYLKAFEICVKESDPKTIMTSYNILNGTRVSENADLITWILRGEWGFRGLVMTDWHNNGRHGTEIMAGSDLKMPVGDPEMVIHYTRGGTMAQGQVEEACRNVLKLILGYEGVDLWKEEQA